VNDQPSDFGGKQGIEEYNFTHWLKVRYVNGKIVKTEDPKLTWEKSKWKSFFASENEFAKGFKFDSQANTFSVAWVYKKGNCIQPSVERAFDEAARWICKSPS
jgi:hypothetical protein